MGKYEFNRVPFGLAQAPAHFQKLINKVLTDCNFAMGYLDDIIIFSKTKEEHLEHLETIFNRLHEAGLKLKLQKCSFFKKHIQYLGHLISDEGIQPLLEKLESIAKMPTPKNAKQVKQFLGLVGYYRKFVPRFADISRILTKLTRKDQEFKWTPECDKMLPHAKRLPTRSTDSEISRPSSKLHTLHRRFKICLRRCTHTMTGRHRSPSCIRQWTFQRKPTQLGSPHKRSICNIHVSEETQLLPRLGTYHSPQ